MKSENNNLTKKAKELMKEETKKKEYRNISQICKWIFTKWYFWLIMFPLDLFLIRNPSIEGVISLIKFFIFEFICFFIGRIIYVYYRKNNNKKIKKG